MSTCGVAHGLGKQTQKKKIYRKIFLPLQSMENSMVVDFKAGIGWTF